MAHTNSISFPNMFDVARGVVQVLEDNASVVNRNRLLILTEPTELYNNPDFGVGLKRHLWKYNQPNEKALIRDRIAAQLLLHEPCAKSEETTFADGLLFSGSNAEVSHFNSHNQLQMTVGIQTTYGTAVNVDVGDMNQLMEIAQQKYSDLHS